jgi:hypothetical protein
MKPYLIVSALAFLAALGLYGYQLSTHTHTLGMNRLAVLGLGFVGCFSLLLAIVAFFVGLAKKKPVTN